MLPQIERYELEREIGHGGMATVYRARDVRLDRWVAIKVMHPHLRGAAEARARFSREARAVAKLHHPSILEIYDYSGLESDNAYIAAELLTGPTLRVFAESQPEVPPEAVACIGVELASALAAAHAHGIVHRDVKPENVLLHEDRVVKLTDFGIAGMLDPSASAMTATGQLLGSPAHMSPEQITDGDADPRSDVFALGTILYWLATGKLPFDGNNAHQVLKRVVDDAPLHPLRLRPEMGSEFASIVMCCLEKQPDARFQSAELLAERLTEWLQALDVEDPRRTLAEYLADPPATAARLREGSVRALLRRAQQSVETARRAEAIECLDRVLALQDGHPQALALLERLDRASRYRLLWRWGGATAAAGVMLALAALLWPSPAPPLGSLGSLDVPADTGTDPRLVDVQEVSEPRMSMPAATDEGLAEGGQVPRADSGVTTPSQPDAAARKAPEVPDGAPRSGPRRATAPTPVRPPRPEGPRRVVFKPYPVNVSIAVDEGPLTPLGPDFQNIELEPGDHRFRFVGARECCLDKTLEVSLPPGPGTTVLEPRLQFRPARLYVVSNVPANVDVGEGRAGGRTRSVISVPVDRSLIEPHRISVTAPGHEPYTRNVSLRAGKVKQIRVDLTPSEMSP